MPKITVLPADNWVTIGPLAAATDFQVRDGSLLITTEAPPDANHGFDRRAGGSNDTMQIGTGKTVRVRANQGPALLHYETLAS